MCRRLLVLTSISVLLLLASAGCSGRRYTTNMRVYSADKGPQETFYDATNSKILQENVWVFQPDGTYAAKLTLDGQLVDWAGQYDAHNQGKDFVIAVDTNEDGRYEETLFVNRDISVEWQRPGGSLTYYLVIPSGDTEE